MATDLQTPSDRLVLTEQSTTSLVAGIIGDLQKLVEQQFLLTRREIEKDINSFVQAALIFSVGLGTCFLGGFSLCLAAAHGMYAWGSPGSDPGTLPMWACHAIVCAVLFLLGGGFLLAGRSRFQAITPLEGPHADALKENVEWTTQS